MAACPGICQKPCMLTLLLYVIVILTTIWVGVDSHRNQIPTGKNPYSGGNAMVWVVMCLALWIVAFPVYLVKRAKTLKGRNPEAGAPVAASVAGGLAIALVLLCIVGTIIWGSGITVGSDRLSDADLAKQVRQSIEGKWKENPASKDIRMKDVTLEREAGDEYSGVVTAEISGQEKRLPLKVTYDGKRFVFRVSSDELPAGSPEPKSPEDQLRAKVGKNIESMWKGDRTTRNNHLKSITLTHENGNEYSGVATADVSGQEKTYPFQVTYDAAHNNISLRMGEEEKRMTDDQLRDDVRKTIEKKFAENPDQQNVHLKSMTLARQSGNDYAGMAIIDVAGLEEKHYVKVTYDGRHYSYDLGDQLPMSLDELRDAVGAMIESRYRSNPKSANVHFKSMTLAHRSGNDYNGTVIAIVSGNEEQHPVHVHYDGSHYSYEVQ